MIEIMSGIKAVSDALRLAKELCGIDGQVDQAELKLRLVDLTDKLLEAKEALQDAKEREQRLRGEINEIKAKHEEQSKLRDREGMLFDIDEDECEIGEPYCNRCFVRFGKKYRLRHRGGFMGGSIVVTNVKPVAGRTKMPLRSKSSPQIIIE